MVDMVEKNGKSYYFIGIGGISMAGLAQYLFECGNTVSGSDSCGGEMVEKLRKKGIEVAVLGKPQFAQIDMADVVVYTDAIPKENKELAHAISGSKTLLSRAELLGMICRDFLHTVAVGGSHGKTTCTAMCAHILMASKLRFCAHIGGEDLTLSNFWNAGNEYFVTEACEYKKNLLKLSAEVAILLNVDRDHMECYNGEEDLYGAFSSFCHMAKRAVVCLDDPVASRVENAVTFSLYERKANYRAVYLRQERERYSFSVLENGVKVCRIHLKTVGRCNVYNALAAFAAMRLLGISVREIKLGLEGFQGVKRRFEGVGRYNGAEIVCDYAHHPREIDAVVKTAERMVGGRLYVVFQPHTYSRTKQLMNEFVEVLRPIERLMVYKTYPARECFDANGDGMALAEKIGGCLYADSITALRIWLDSTVSEGDFVLFLGAGDIYYVAKYLVNLSRLIA